MKQIQYIAAGFTFVVGLFCAGNHLFAQSGESNLQNRPSDNVYFDAMQGAITDNMNNLKLENLKPPFYIDYLITNAKMISVEASLGGINKSIERPLTNFNTTVLVGDYQQNNLNFYNENSLFGYYGGSFEIPLPLTPDNSSIRRSLWIETDNAYKAAAELIESKIGSIAQQNIPAEELNLADLSKIPVQTKIISDEIGVIQKATLENLTKELSLVLGNYPHFTKSGANAYVYEADAYYLNNEGVKYKQPFHLICLRIYAETIADDGEPLMDYINLYYTDTKQIPALDALKAETSKMASLLEQLRTAPVISETYSGPVLFEGEAVGEIIAQSFIENSNGLLTGRKPLTSNSDIIRWNSRALPKENSLEALLGKKVISRDLTVTALDGLTEYNAIPLIGSYELDAEGVSVKSETPLVVDGVLKTLLSDRIPTLKISESNGHSRLALSDGDLSNVLCSGVIELKSSNKMSASKLKKKLIALAKEEDFEYAYIVRKMASPMAGVPGLSRYLPEGNTGGMTKPIYVYKVSVKDGSETLVRMTKVSDLNIKSFKRVVSVTDKQQVYNTMLKGKKRSYYSYSSGLSLVGIPGSFIVPEGILFQELEVEKDKNVTLKKDPIVPNPLSQVK